jgi:ADP-heptose:LPS heptosyltransferase
VNDPLQWPKAQQQALANQHRTGNLQRPLRTRRQQLRLALLRLAGAAHREHAAAPVSGPPKRILLIRPDHLGDLLFCTPALHALRAAWPAAHITACVGPWSAAILRHNRDVDTVRTLPFPGFARQAGQGPWQPYRLLWHEGQRLRDEHFDLAIVLRFDHWWGAWLAQRAGIPQRVGYAVAECQPFLTQAVPYQTGRHEVVQNLALIEAVMRQRIAAPARLTFPIPADAQAWVHTWRAAAGLAEQPYVVVHPGAGAPVKLWPAPAWAGVIDGLRDRGLPVVLTGGAAERDLVAGITGQVHGPVHALAGATDLDQLAALMQQSCLTVGLDSGPLHLAVAVGVPTVHLYGPVATATFGPWGDPARHRVLTSDWACVPCNRLDFAAAELPRHPCVRALTPGSVLQAIDEVLALSEERTGFDFDIS